MRLPFAEKPQVTVGGAAVEAKPLEFTIGTPDARGDRPAGAAPASTTPRAARHRTTTGCPCRARWCWWTAAPARSPQKQAVAAERGAVAMIVANNDDGDEMGGTLGEDTDAKIPVVSVTKASGERLRANAGRNHPQAQRRASDVERTRNVIAQTKTGSTADVVMVGAHLDSVPEGPGINDNGSGVAAVLETALQLGSRRRCANAVRFGFWGAEELGLIGSNNYVESLDVDAAQGHRAVPELRHARLAEPRLLHLRRRSVRAADPPTAATRGCRRARRASSARWSPT